MTNDLTISYLLKRNRHLKSEIITTEKKIIQLHLRLQKIRSSKYYYIWRCYCHLKESLTFHEN